jgi:signal transduction histidine kinase
MGFCALLIGVHALLIGVCALLMKVHTLLIDTCAALIGLRERRSGDRSVANGVQPWVPVPEEEKVRGAGKLHTNCFAPLGLRRFDSNFR